MKDLDWILAVAIFVAADVLALLLDIYLGIIQ